MTEKSYPSNALEIKAGGGGVRGQKAKIIYIFPKWTEKLNNHQRPPSIREPLGQSRPPVPQQVPETQENYAGSNSEVWVLS